MPTLTGAGAILCAAHRGADGRMHGHTWEITAWWPADGSDALALQARLQYWIDQIDHDVLPADLSLAEQIAEQAGRDLAAIEVQVWRAGERLGARWTAE